MQNYAWLIFALLGATFAAIVNVLSKKALDAMDFTIALTLQCGLMLLTLIVIVSCMGRWNKIADAPRWAAGLILLSGIAAGLSWFFGYQALQLSQVARATPIDKLSMPIAVLLAIVFLRERPSGFNWLGIALMLIGAFFVAAGKKTGS